MSVVLSATMPLGLSMAHAQAGFNYLDDQAEAGGYDVTATVTSLPAELTLAEQKNGDGYRLRLAPDSVQLSTETNGVAHVLARMAGNIGPGSFVAQRRGPRWRVISGNHVVLQAEDDRWHEGRIGTRGGIKDARVQPIEDVFFDDDFMRVASDVAMAQAKDDPHQGVRIADVKIDETLWRNLTGTWATTGLSENEQAQVAQSANPFVFKTSGVGSNLSVAGRPFWSDYSAEVSARPEGSSAIGLAVYCQDAKNYLMFYWKANGPMQLRAVVNGQPKVLDQAAGGYEAKQWYRLRFSVSGGLLRAYVDDAEVLRARTGLFGRGQVGLYAENPTSQDSASFDDVAVRSIKDVQDDFSSPIPGRWQTVAGTWSLGRVAQPTSTAGAFAVMGESVWKDYVTGAQITVPADAAAGLVLDHKTGQGAYLLRAAGSHSKLPYAGKVQIVKIATGSTKVLGETAIGSRFDGKPVVWMFSDDRGYLRGSANGTRIVDAYDESLRSGRPGLFAQRGTAGVPRISEFTVEFPRPHATWAKVPELYDQERQAETMGGWSTPEGFWVASAPVASIVTPVATTTSNKVLWHKGTFWGDGSIRFKLPALDGSQELKLLFDRIQKTSGSVTLSLRATAGTLHANLTRSGAATPATGELKLDGPVSGQPIEVSERGSFMIVRVGSPDKARTLLVTRVA